jgi:hypothetical protein
MRVPWLTLAIIFLIVSLFLGTAWWVFWALCIGAVVSYSRELFGRGMKR